MLILALSIVSGFVAAGAVWYSWDLFDNLTTLKNRRQATIMVEQQAGLEAEDAPKEDDAKKNSG